MWCELNAVPSASFPVLHLQTPIYQSCRKSTVDKTSLNISGNNTILGFTVVMFFDKMLIDFKMRVTEENHLYSKIKK
jgi:hypothetical protein